MHFMLFVGVDSENRTVVFAQGFFSDQSSDTYTWALEQYCKICGVTRRWACVAYVAFGITRGVNIVLISKVLVCRTSCPIAQFLAETTAIFALST